MKPLFLSVMSIVFIGSFAMEHPQGLPFEVFAAISMRQGGRSSMEDFGVVIPCLTSESAFFAVYDGHCGEDAARYGCNELDLILKSKLEILPAKEALVQSFEEVDRLIKEKNIKSGSTALVALLQRDQLHIAWAGDSRAVVVRDNKVIFETLDHKSHIPQEKERIEKKGCFVDTAQDSRTKQMISRMGPDGFAMSRALGNHDYECKKKGAMIATPEVHSLAIKPNDTLILGTDGLWDDQSTHNVVELLGLSQGMKLHSSFSSIIKPKENEYIETHSNNDHLKATASCMRDTAVGKHPDGIEGCDNITVMLVKFKAKQSQ